MIGWDAAVVELEETGKVKECPYCKSKAVAAEKIIGKRRDSYWFSCKACGKSAHYSGELKQVNCRRYADPPEYLEQEAEHIAEMFFAQFADDEVIPEDAYSEFMRKHASKELLAYMNSYAVASDSRIKCPCCGVTNVYDYDICEECSWENDPVQRTKPDFGGGANEMSLMEAQTAYKNGIEIH